MSLRKVFKGAAMRCDDPSPCTQAQAVTSRYVVQAGVCITVPHEFLLMACVHYTGL